MREIKFRAWDNMSQEMIQVTGIDFVGPSVIDPYTRWGDFKSGGERSDVVLLQYTGLKDVNGKDIYEGDIIKETWNEYNPYSNYFTSYKRSTIYAVEFIPPSFLFKSRKGGQQVVIENRSMRIIGNIYENPELVNYGD